MITTLAGFNKLQFNNMEKFRQGDPEEYSKWVASLFNMTVEEYDMAIQEMMMKFRGFIK